MIRSAEELAAFDAEAWRGVVKATAEALKKPPSQADHPLLRTLLKIALQRPMPPGLRPAQVEAIATEAANVQRFLDQQPRTRRRVLQFLDEALRPLARLLEQRPVDDAAVRAWWMETGA